MPALACLIVIASIAGPAAAHKKRPSVSLRGYTIMAGGLGRAPKGDTDMWSNTVAAHLAFIEKAHINLVVLEVSYGVNKRFPKSSRVASFIKTLQKKQVQVWVIYPHVLAQTFDLPRQVDREGKRVEWKVCFNRKVTRDWLVENGKKIVQAYAPDGLLLFGLFHKGGACFCESCKKDKEARSGKIMERFFQRWSREVRGVRPGIRLGTTGFWTSPSCKTLACVDVVSPVVGIFRPGYAGKGRVKKELLGLRSRYKGKQLVPYVKLFLASQTSSKTEDVLTAAREALRYGDGFFFWGYNPGHSHRGQDYDHGEIESALRAMASKKRHGSPTRIRDESKALAGRKGTVPFRPASARRQREPGWALASWLRRHGAHGGRWGNLLRGRISAGVAPPGRSGRES